MRFCLSSFKQILSVFFCVLTCSSLSFGSESTISSYLNKSGIGQIKFYDRSGLQKFYAERDNEPVWLKGNHFSKKSEQILSVFENSWTHGLNPESYAVKALQEAFTKGLGDDPLYYEALMSAAVVLYGRDMTSMRIPPSEINQKSKFWQKPLGAYSILSFVASDRNPKAALRALPPQGAFYKSLQKELVLALEEMNKGDETESVLPLSLRKTLRVGDRHGLVEDIRYRLYAPAVQKGSDPTIYDDQLSQSVMAYQTRYGLKADGIIGGKTINALNRTLRDRSEQIIVNLERLRWIAPDMPEKYLIVNIPAQTLWAMEEGKVVHEMPVIIGRFKRQTNSFITKVTGVRFNPTWTVPETIKFEDYVPKLTEDPNYLNDKGVEFFWGSGADALTLPPEAIQWEHLSRGDIKAIRMVQGPGVNNPLGRIRLHMPNQYNIYLHDTNNQGYFEKEDRALSSGCVRMSDPKKIAQFVLKSNKNWAEENMQTLLDKGKMRDVMLKKTIPVYILYQTIWGDDEGKLVYGQDVYGRDKLLMKTLKKYGAVFSY